MSKSGGGGGSGSGGGSTDQEQKSLSRSQRAPSRRSFRGPAFLHATKKELKRQIRVRARREIPAKRRRSNVPGLGCFGGKKESCTE